MSVRTKEKKAATPVDTLKKRSQLFEIWDRLRTNKLAMVGMGIVIVLILCAIFADVIAPYGINDQNLSERLMYPCLAHPLGTDNNGRDILSRIIYGGRISLLVSLMAVVCSVVTGGLIGAISGYFGGRIDTVIMRLMDMLMAIPGTLLAICVSCHAGQRHLADRRGRGRGRHRPQLPA